MSKKTMKLALAIGIATAGALTSNGYAQVTIGSGTEPHPGALLDLKQSNGEGATSTKGLLLPRVSLENEETLQLGSDPTAEEDLAATGMIVWNTNPYALSGIGTYQWDGEKWWAIKTDGIQTLPPSIPTARVAYRNSTSGDIDGYLEFMTYNLGAIPISNSASSIKDQLLTVSPTWGSAENFSDVFGSLYQWGRSKEDGHQNVWSQRYPSDNDEEENGSAPDGSLDANGQISDSKDSERYGKFIKNTTTYPHDWLVTKNDDLWWDGAKTVNDPCPPGFRIPTQAEWSSIVTGSSIQELLTSPLLGVNKWLRVAEGTNPSLADIGIDLGGTVRTAGYLIYPPSSEGGYETTPAMFLPAAGHRSEYGVLEWGNFYCDYWSSTVDDSNAYRLYLRGASIYMRYSEYRACGLSVRCLKEPGAL